MDSKTPDKVGLPPSALNEQISELQINKLELEIKELRRPWWQRPAYLSVLFPLFIGFLTILVAYNRGFFDTEAARLELRRERLQRDVDAFTAERNRLITTNKDLSQENANLIAERNHLIAEQRRLNDQAASVDLQRKALSIELSTITLTENIKELSNALGDEIPTSSSMNLKGPWVILDLRKPMDNPFYQKILSELKRKDAHQQARIKIVSEQIHTQGNNLLVKAFLLSALAQATGDSSCREKLIKLTIDNELDDSRWLTDSLLALVTHGPFTIGEKASVLVRIAATLRDSKTNTELLPLRMFKVADQSPEVLDACVPSPMIEAIRLNRDYLLNDVKAQADKDLKQVLAAETFNSPLKSWGIIQRLSPQAALVYLAEISSNTGRRITVRGPAEFSYQTGTINRSLESITEQRQPLNLDVSSLTWPESPFPRPAEITERTPQGWADWLKENRKISKLWLDQQLDVISKDPVLLKKVNRRQWIEPKEIP